MWCFMSLITYLCDMYVCVCVCVCDIWSKLGVFAYTGKSIRTCVFCRNKNGLCDIFVTKWVCDIKGPYSSRIRLQQQFRWRHSSACLPLKRSGIREEGFPRGRSEKNVRQMKVSIVKLFLSYSKTIHKQTCKGQTYLVLIKYHHKIHHRRHKTRRFVSFTE